MPGADDADEARQRELNRRLEALSRHTDADFGGPLSHVELGLAWVAFVLVPGLVAWWFR